MREAEINYQVSGRSTLMVPYHFGWKYSPRLDFDINVKWWLYSRTDFLSSCFLCSCFPRSPTFGGGSSISLPSSLFSLRAAPESPQVFFSRTWKFVPTSERKCETSKSSCWDGAKPWDHDTAALSCIIPWGSRGGTIRDSVAYLLHCVRSHFPRLTLLGPYSRFGDKLVRIWVGCPQNGTAVLKGSTLLGPQSRFGDKLLRVWVVCPQNGTAVLKGLTWHWKSTFEIHTSVQTGIIFTPRVVSCTWYQVLLT